MTIGIDTYYRSDSDAYTVGVIFDSWTDKVPKQIISCKTSEFAPYIPGELGDRCPKLIGVAKTEFGKCHEISEEVIRGKAKVPLYVQGYGMSNEEAACLIKNMYGPYRIPDILKILDKETKKKEGL